MSITLKDLAKELNISQSEILTKLSLAGIKKSLKDSLSLEEKNDFLNFLLGNKEKIIKRLSLNKKKLVSQENTISKEQQLIQEDNNKVKVAIKRKKILKLNNLNDVIIPIEGKESDVIHEINENASLLDNNVIEDPELFMHNTQVNKNIEKIANDNNQVAEEQNKKPAILLETPVDKAKIDLMIEEELEKKRSKAKSFNNNKKNKMKLIGKEDSSLADMVLEEESFSFFEEPTEDRANENEIRQKKEIKIPKIQEFTKPIKPRVLDIVIPLNISVADLAHKMSIKSTDIIKKLMKLGIIANVNQNLDQDTAILIVEECGHKPVTHFDNPEDLINNNILNKDVQLEPRAPIVTVMGHVDHGKTSLLDYIRKTKVVNKEAGGITQHIGAYHVDTGHGIITFLDTPGHEAFTALRARGAKITDIVVLVIAADDGVMPQTIEAINHAKVANVPIVVAINKIDKTNGNIEKIKEELSRYQVLAEDWGGDVMFIPVSAIHGTGINNLLDAILLQAEVLELKAPVTTNARGIIIESKLDKGRGVLVSVLILSGTLKKGDLVIVGNTYGRIRSLLDETQKVIQSAGPSIPVEILGLNELPQAGDDLIQIEDEKLIKEIIAHRIQNAKEEKLRKEQKAKTDNIFGVDQNIKNLNIIVKSDVQGSYEAIVGSLQKLSTEEVKVQMVHSAIGGINESDVNLAIATNSLIIGFNVRADNNAKKLAESNGINIRYYNIIYDIIDDIKLSLQGMHSLEERETITGTLEVRQIFTLNKVNIAGAMVLNGLVKRNSKIRIIRDSKVIFDGELSSLKRFKDDVKEVKSGYECGFTILNFNDIKINDLIESYEITEHKKIM